jgi:hypothetical protein
MQFFLKVKQVVPPVTTILQRVKCPYIGLTFEAVEEYIYGPSFAFWKEVRVKLSL